MRPRANCYRIDRIEYVPRAARYDVPCIVVWMGLFVLVFAFWFWCLP